MFNVLFPTQLMIKYDSKIFNGIVIPYSLAIHYWYLNEKVINSSRFT